MSYAGLLEAPADFAERRQPSLAIALIEIDIIATIASRGDVVDATGQLRTAGSAPFGISSLTPVDWET